MSKHMVEAYDETWCVYSIGSDDPRVNITMDRGKSSQSIVEITVTATGMLLEMRDGGAMQNANGEWVTELEIPVVPF